MNLEKERNCGHVKGSDTSNGKDLVYDELMHEVTRMIEAQYSRTNQSEVPSNIRYNNGRILLKTCTLIESDLRTLAITDTKVHATLPRVNIQ